MKHYINDRGDIFAFEEDGSQDHLIQPAMQPISQAQVDEKNRPTIGQISDKVRGIRDGLLTESDYLVMPDYPDKPQGIESYRQALRDITEQPGFPEAVEWPER